MAAPIDIGGMRWFRFLSRCSLVFGLVFLGTMLVYTIGLLPATSGSALPEEYGDLVMASSRPALYRVAALLDLAVWLATGGFLLALAALLARRAPSRGALIAASGIGQVAGVIGSFIKLDGIGDLANRYAAAVPEQQAVLLRSHLDLQLLLTAHLSAGQVLYAAAYLLVATVAWSMPDFPRWLTSGLALVGGLALTGFGIRVATGVSVTHPVVFTLAFLEFTLTIVIAFAVAWVFWRRSPEVVPTARGTSAH